MICSKTYIPCVVLLVASGIFSFIPVSIFALFFFQYFQELWSFFYTRFYYECFLIYGSADFAIFPVVILFLILSVTFSLYFLSLFFSGTIFPIFVSFWASDFLKRYRRISRIPHYFFYRSTIGRKLFSSQIHNTMNIQRTQGVALWFISWCISLTYKLTKFIQGISFEGTDLWKFYLYLIRFQIIIS